MKKLKVLVTGSNGFLGSHTIYALLERGHHVLATHRASSNLWRLNHVQNKIELLEMDLLETQSINKVFETSRPDAVIHCAAYGVKYEEQDEKMAFAVNVHGTSNLIHCAESKSISRFIHMGSCFEYGNKDYPVKEDEILQPTSIYGASKAAATLMALAVARQKNIPLTVVRPFGLWGPMEEKHRLIPQIISHCSDKKELKLTGCKQIRDYTFVEDAAIMLIDLLELTEFPSHEIFNLGSSKSVTLKEFVLNAVSFFNLEELMLFGKLPYRPTEMWHLVANTEKWTKHIGPIRKTSVSEGIQKMLKYEGENHEKN